jgi:antagonist of KipI
MIVVERAPPYLTIQDRGRFGYRASGVPVAGAMDQWSFARANQLVGNERNAAAFEWAIGAGTLRFTMDATIAITGAQVEAAIDDRAVTSGSSIAVGAGELLSVKRLIDLRFIYIAVAGGLDCPEVLGSRSTYLPATLGGHEGRRLRTGDQIDVGENATGLTSTDEKVSAPNFRSDTLRVIAADSDSFDQVAQLTFRVSQMSDRMGYRLECQGDAVPGASVTSEPVCPGTIQLPPDGQPIVLMADSPTIGGYRVVGAVISDDLPILAQCMPGRRVKFVSFE